MRGSRRFLALLLALMLVCGCAGTMAAAAEGEQTAVTQDAQAAGDQSADGVQPEANYEYTLTEETVIQDDDVPLGAGPREADCCILHFLLMLCALGVAVFYAWDRKRRQMREFELRSVLQ